MAVTIEKSDFKVLSVDDKEDWQQVLSEVHSYDFYHLPSYHKIAELLGEGKAYLLAYTESDYTIIFPILIRPICNIVGLEDVGENWNEVTSVYGYPGPVHSGKLVPDNIRQGFLAAVEQFFNTQRVVAAFSRLHPLFEQDSLLAGYGEIKAIGPTLSIDLTLSPEEQIAQYRKNTRREVAEAGCGDLYCFEDIAGQYWDEFADIYYETMDRVGSSPAYYFAKEYFAYLRDDMSDIFHLFVCKQGDRVACAALFALCDGIIQYHLSGIREEYLATSPSPNRLLIDNVRQWGNEVGAYIFHLGGGVGGKRDSLFNFKRSFSKREHTFSVWHYVANEDVYKQLLHLQHARTKKAPTDSFFPMYRHPDFAERTNSNIMWALAPRGRQ